jgi:hypothetical protein
MIVNKLQRSLQYYVASGIFTKNDIEESWKEKIDLLRNLGH